MPTHIPDHVGSMSHALLYEMHVYSQGITGLTCHSSLGRFKAYSRPGQDFQELEVVQRLLSNMIKCLINLMYHIKQGVLRG